MKLTVEFPSVSAHSVEALTDALVTIHDDLHHRFD
jgi:hypothetical protein